MERTQDQDVIINAMEWCKDRSGRHSSSSIKTILFLLFFVILLLAAGYMIFKNVDIFISTDLQFIKTRSEYVQKILLGIFSLSIIAISVGVSLYRFHLREKAKYDQYLMGLMRIRIAGNNSPSGYDSEVRKALTEAAFEFTSTNSIFGKSEKSQKIESPLPGHPASDVAANILSNLLSNMELKSKV